MYTWQVGLMLTTESYSPVMVGWVAPSVHAVDSHGSGQSWSDAETFASTEVVCVFTFHDERDTPLSLSRHSSMFHRGRKLLCWTFLTRPVAARHVHVAGGTNAHHQVVLTSHGGMGSPFGTCCWQPWVGPKLKWCRDICLNWSCVCVYVSWRKGHSSVSEQTFIDVSPRQKIAMLHFLTRPVAARHVHVAGGTNAHYRVVLTCECHGGTGSPFGTWCQQPRVGLKLKWCRVIICLNWSCVCVFVCFLL